MRRATIVKIVALLGVWRGVDLRSMNTNKPEKQFTALRRPAEETEDLYAGLCVCDDRVSGSITVGPSRLPLWAFVATIVMNNWEAVADEEDGDFPQVEKNYGWTQQMMADFLYYAMQSRGEFGRLTLLMAEMNRRSEADQAPWLLDADNRQQMKAQLQKCLDALEE